MATQLVRCSWSLRKDIHETGVGKNPVGNAGNYPEVSLELLRDGARSSAIAVILHDHKFAWGDWPLDSGRVFTPLLAAGEALDRRLESRPLPDDRGPYLQDRGAGVAFVVIKGRAQSRDGVIRSQIVAHFE
jgi:hypothetical protein